MKEWSNTSRNEVPKSVDALLTRSGIPIHLSTVLPSQIVQLFSTVANNSREHFLLRSLTSTDYSLPQSLLSAGRPGSEIPNLRGIF